MNNNIQRELFISWSYRDILIKVNVIAFHCNHKWRSRTTCAHKILSRRNYSRWKKITNILNGRNQLSHWQSSRMIIGRLLSRVLTLPLGKKKKNPILKCSSDTHFPSDLHDHTPFLFFPVLPRSDNVSSSPEKSARRKTKENNSNKSIEMNNPDALPGHPCVVSRERGKNGSTRLLLHPKSNRISHQSLSGAILMRFKILTIPGHTRNRPCAKNELGFIVGWSHAR